MATEQFYINSDKLSVIVQAAAKVNIEWKDFVIGAAVEKAETILKENKEVETDAMEKI